MENKYYTPDLEDLFVGYEYEILNSEDIWENKKLEFSFGWLEIPENFNENIRTKYLTKEQIENEGWEIYNGRAEFKKCIGYYDKEDDLTGTEYLLDYNEKTNHLIIECGTINFGEAYYPYEGHNHIFSGQVKSINEFRKVIKMVINI